MNSHPPPRPRSLAPALVLLAAAVAAVVLVLWLNGADNAAICTSRPVDVPWWRAVLAYGGAALAAAGVVLAVRARGTGRARGALAAAIAAALVAAVAVLAVVSTHNLLDTAKHMADQPHPLVVCT